VQPDSSIELPPEKQRLVSELHAKLDVLTHYQLLGVPEAADRKAVKSAYYALAPEFHPDRYFRKNLGHFRPMLEAVFSRITLAHDVLTSKDRRAEYDEYLTLAREGASLGAAPADVERVLADVERLAQAAVNAAPASDPSAASRASVTPPPPRASSLPPAPATMPPPSGPRRSEEEVQRDRRAAFAARLTGGFRRQTAAAPAPTPPPPVASAQERALALKTRWEVARSEARRQQLEKYRLLGLDAMGRGEFISAATNFRMACALQPDDADLQRLREECEQKAAAAQADENLRAAESAAQQGNWGVAAQAYARVCVGRPGDSRAHERCANALIRGGGDARRAVILARRAAELDPGRGTYRLTLARAYFFAGLKTSAEGELDRALLTAGLDGTLRQAVEELRKEFAKK
jgi:curved DNA-binding protein CbpA